MRVSKGVRLSGTVRDRADRPLGGVAVWATGVTGFTRGRTYAVTDAAGRFEMRIARGDYHINLEPTKQLAGWYRESDATNHWTLASAQATTVRITRTMSLPVIRPKNGLSIGGRVTDRAGAGLRGAVVKATSGAQEVTVVTGAQGSYRLAPLAPGTWHLRFSPPRGRPELAPKERNVTISSNLTGQNVALRVGAKISGRFTVDGAPSGMLDRVVATDTATGERYFADLAADGRYTFVALPDATFTVGFEGYAEAVGRSTYRVLAAGFYKSGAPGNVTNSEAQATRISVSNP